MKPAAIHLHTVEEGESTDRHVCEDCLADDGPATRAWLDEIKNATCTYCGGSPCSHSTDTLGMVLACYDLLQHTFASPPMHWLCFQCSAENNPHVLAGLKKVPENLPPA